MTGTRSKARYAMVAMNDFQAVAKIANRVNRPFAVDVAVRRPDDKQHCAQGGALIEETLEEESVVHERDHMREG